MRVLVSRSFVVGSVLVIAACGGAAPPAAPTAPKSSPVAKGEPPPDVSPVGEPDGLVVVGRVAKPDGILRTVGGWTRLPLPGGAELVRSVTDDAVGDVVDLSQPVDGAVALGGTRRDPQPLAALSVAVKSFDTAKAKLGAKHKLTPGPNGSFWVEGIGKPDVGDTAHGRDGAPSADAEDHDDAEEDGNGIGCSLAHAPSGGRLVCGPKPGVDALSAYLTRNVSRQTWSSDVHVEIRPAALREPLAQARALMPVLAGSALGGASPAVRDLLDAAASEMVDFVGDTGKILLDAQIADAGAGATVRVEYQRAQSFFAKAATSYADRAKAPPAAFWRLPAETDLAFYSDGSDPQLYQRPREILGNVVSEIADKEQMPEAERKALRDLLVDRTLPLFVGGMVYAKGFDQAAVDKAVEARKALKTDDLTGKEEADRTLGAQVVGWHLLQVSEPFAKVGPMLKDWAALWARPGFSKWAKQKSSAKMLAKVRAVPAPAGVTLPKEAVHLEITIPREDLEIVPPSPAPTPSASGKRTVMGPVAIAKSVKKIPRKPTVLHVIAVPDQGATWIGFGLDGKLVAQKALASLSTARDVTTFGSGATAAQVRDLKASGAWIVTLRGLLVLTAMERGGKSYALLGSLANKGTSPIVMSFAAHGPSPTAAAGSSVTTMNVPRSAIEDIVKLAIASH